MSIIGYKKVSSSGFDDVIAILDIPKPIVYDDLANESNTDSRRVKINNPNNMNRSNIMDPFCAQYRCQQAYVLKIFVMKTGRRLKEARSLFNPNFIYREGEWVETIFDPDINQICSNGIHYFLNIECAKYYQSWFFPNVILNDKHKRWHGNGQIACQYIYKNGKLDSVCKFWDERGILLQEETYEKGEIKQRVKNGQIVDL